MIYEWDGAKNRSNYAKHGLDFADAELVFAVRREQKIYQKRLGAA
jgi:uncharacterized DUF497 family protein